MTKKAVKPQALDHMYFDTKYDKQYMPLPTQMKSNLSSQEQKNTSNTNQSEAPETLDSLSKYDKKMIEKYQSKIKGGTLTIQESLDLKSLNFINTLEINQLTLYECKNIVPQLESLTIIKLQLTYCDVQSVKDFQLENLEVLEIYNNICKLKSKILTQEIVRFKQLKELTIYNCITDFSPFSQMLGLTKLSLIQCNLRSTEALRPLELEELYLNGNEEIDIISLQFQTKLTKLSLEYCNLDSLDVLRPLKKLQELDIRYNIIVYLQPLMELKQISKINARSNKIIDTESIQQHPNFNKFSLDKQERPTQEQLKTAKIMRDIQNPITSLKQTCQQLSRIKKQYQNFRQKINQQLQQSYSNHEQFVARVALLFQQMNVFNGCQ
ncbi:S-layer_homology domain-containing protein [Hexamita inflata]|uniref:S-layer homology domain-containing protein n=1 Tax=Hexamita inflata TaxID=28002 RepID=A0AA86UZL9_9EUKA|nr:S-layer homology domain-containing protein [Hexamita inflata]